MTSPTQAQIDAAVMTKADARIIAAGLLEPRTKAEILAAIDKLLELTDDAVFRPERTFDDIPKGRRDNSGP